MSLNLPSGSKFIYSNFHYENKEEFQTLRLSGDTYYISSCFFLSSKGLITMEIQEDGSVTRSASTETTGLEENSEVRASLGFKIVPEKVLQLNPR